MSLQSYKPKGKCTSVRVALLKIQTSNDSKGQRLKRFMREGTKTRISQLQPKKFKPISQLFQTILFFRTSEVAKNVQDYTS